MQIEYYYQENGETVEKFINRVENRINTIISPYRPERKLVNLQWFCDNDSYYPYSCIITFYVGYSSS